jgi:predicted CopG family antitoxin
MQEVLMQKTITMRINDDVYEMFKKAAHGSRRTISNFLEYATLSFLSQDTYVSDHEMKEILKDNELIENLKQGEKEIRSRRFKIVG